MTVPILDDGANTSSLRVFLERVLERVVALEAADPDTIITTRGDLIRGAASGDAERYALGAAGTLLISNGTDAVWSATITHDTTLAEGVDFAVGTATGTKIGTGATQKLGFFGATPVVQPSALTQTFSTADATHANRTATAHTYPGSGNLFDAVAADLLINIRTDSTANAVADTVVNIKSLADNLNQNIADLADTAAFVNSIADKLQDLGILS